MQTIVLTQGSGRSEVDAFREDVLEGMAKKKKMIPHRYSYTGEGGQIFQAVLEKGGHYYSLPVDEVNLFKEQAPSIINLLSASSFNLVDLGAGDGRKTKILIEEGLKKKCDFRYIPIDYSRELAQDLTKDIQANYPNLTGTTLIGDMHQGIKWTNQNRKEGEKNVLLILGGTFGNYEPDEIEKFVSYCSSNMKKGDIFGCTLWMFSDPFQMQSAYSNQCPSNYNFIHVFSSVFKKINQDLNANFDLEYLKPHAFYDPYRKYIEVCVMSTKEQTIKIDDKEFKLEQGEAIQGLISRRWTSKQAQQSIQPHGLKLVGEFRNQKKNTAFLCFEKQ